MRVTIKDVAKEAGVSVTTVSFVLNNTKFQKISDGTRKKIYDAVEKLGYKPSALARTMRTGKSKALAVVSYFSVTEGHFNEILLGIYDACEKNGYTVIISSVGSNPYEYVELFKMGKIDGVVIICPYDMGVEFSEEENEKLVRENNIPAVFINSESMIEDDVFSKSRHIKFDYFSCGYSACNALIEEENKNIYFVEQEEDDYDRISGQSEEILRGVKACAEFNGMDFGENRVLKPSQTENALEKGASFIASNLACAAKIYKNCIDKGLVIGKDVSVICAIYAAGAEYLYPEISCARLPFYTIGTLGAHDVLNLIEGNKCADSYLMPCSLTRGRSIIKKM